MKVPPFTKQEAFLLMRRFSSVKDAEFSHNDKTYVVRMATIVPFQPKARHEALAMLFKAINEVPGFTTATADNYILSYPADEFDVMLIATSTQNGVTSIYPMSMGLVVSEDGEFDYGFNLE